MYITDTNDSVLLIITHYGIKSPWRNIRSSKQSGMVAGTVTSGQQVRISSGRVQVKGGGGVEGREAGSK